MSSIIVLVLQIRANNTNFKKNVLDAAKQVEDFLLAAGWCTVVRKCHVLLTCRHGNKPTC